MKHFFGILILINVCLVSCKKKLSSIEYVNWYKTSAENCNELKTNSFIYELRYISPEATALMEFGPDKDSISKYAPEFNRWSNFNLKIYAAEKEKDILKYGITQDQEYYERLQYLIADFANDAKILLKNKDTISCAFHHYERTYNVTPFANLTLSFNTHIENIERLIINLPFDNKTAVIDIKEQDYPELKL